jgi:ferrous iron transport protein B
MMDLAKQKKIKIEIEHLAQHLDCKIVPIIAHKKEGIDSLKKAIIEEAARKKISKTQVLYDSVVETAISRIATHSLPYAKENKIDNRWLAIKLLESDELALKITGNKLKNIIENEINKIQKHTGSPVDIVIADGRYGFIHGLTLDVVHRDNEFRKTFSDAVDKIILNRFLGVPIFFFVMYLMFTLTIKVGMPFVNFFDKFMGTIFVDGFGNLLTSLHFPQFLTTVLASGLGGGVQTISTFIPPIFFMFLSLSFLEDSGYMSRAAFIMDKFMRFIGLPGKAFIPMIVGFGCNVPAILATRTLENNRDRILTILINPFMSCSARLPVYALFAAVFFPNNGGTIIFSIYLIGIILAILSGTLFKNTILRGETSIFVMELPPYHLPTINGILLHTWQRLKSFILRAGQVILIVVLLLTFLNSVGVDGSFGNEDSGKSVLSYLGKKITPVFRPMGISDENWPATVGFITGIFAKESVVGTLDALYSQMEDTQNIQKEQEKFYFWKSLGDSFLEIPRGFQRTPKQTTEENLLPTGISKQDPAVAEMQRRFGGKNNAFAYLLFILIYVPCVATIAAIYRETNLRWALFSVSYLTILAWIVATMFYQISSIAIHPASSVMWILILSVTLISAYFIMKLKTKRIRF